MNNFPVYAKRQHADFERFRRPSSETRAMSDHERRLVRPSRLWKCCSHPESEQRPPQFRIPSKSEMNWKTPLSSCLECVVTRYTAWNYRTTFARSIFSFFVLFFIIVHVFAFLLWGVVALHYSRRNVECLTGWMLEAPYYFRHNFVVAFSASWTTASTVGYGAVAPPDDKACQLIRYTLAIEAFVGVIFASFCSAILFTKIQRVEYSANVMFSSCLCLQYGEGVTDAKVDVLQSVGDVEHVSSEDTPFPVLEMRLVNMRGNVSEGEIINASVKCVTTSLRLVNASGQTTAESEHFSDGGDRNSGNEGNVQVGNDSLQLRIKRKYEEMKISPAKHPFFSHGALYCRHELDADSPLLKSKIKKRIRDSGGWPSDLNDPAKIHDCLSKDIYDINVTCKGISNLTADSVVKMHSYKRNDIYIGWTFAKLGYISEKSSNDAEPVIKTDFSLVHDIVPQKGGQSEPLCARKTDTGLMSFLASVTEE